MSSIGSASVRYYDNNASGLEAAWNDIANDEISSKGEMRKLLTKFNSEITYGTADLVFNNADADKDGSVTLTELKKALAKADANVFGVADKKIGDVPTGSIVDAAYALAQQHVNGNSTTNDTAHKIIDLLSDEENGCAVKDAAKAYNDYCSKKDDKASGTKHAYQDFMIKALVNNDQIDDLVGKNVGALLSFIHSVDPGLAEDGLAQQIINRLYQSGKVKEAVALAEEINSSKDFTGGEKGKLAKRLVYDNELTVNRNGDVSDALGVVAKSMNKWLKDDKDFKDMTPKAWAWRVNNDDALKILLQDIAFIDGNLSQQGMAEDIITKLYKSEKYDEALKLYAAIQNSDFLKENTTEKQELTDRLCQLVFNKSNNAGAGAGAGKAKFESMLQNKQHATE